MISLYEFLAKGGIIMIPLGVLSLLTVAIALNQAMFWAVLLLRGKRYSRKILAEARHDLNSARQLANACPRRPIVRFLLAALNLSEVSITLVIQ